MLNCECGHPWSSHLSEGCMHSDGDADEICVCQKTPLKSTINTPEMENEIERAFYAKYPRMTGDCNVDYEHGRWWVHHILTGAAWSVVDCETTLGEEYFDFEQVSEGDDT